MRRQSTSLSSRSLVFMILVTALAVATGWRALSASAVDADDLRGDIPTGEALRDELATVAALNDQLLRELTAAETDLADVFVRRDDLTGDQRALTAEIEAATENLRRVAIQSFIAGDSVDALEFFANVGQVNDLAWRQHLIRNHAGSSQVATERLRGLRERAGGDVEATIERAAKLRADIAGLEIALRALGPRRAEAQQLMPLAEAWDRAAIAIEEGPYGIAPTDKWAALRRCESTDNYAAVNSSGAYRGAYQFDIATWQTVGGEGDPAQAPPEEQDARARELYARRGDAPWPVCGRHLK